MVSDVLIKTEIKIINFNPGLAVPIINNQVHGLHLFN